MPRSVERRNNTRKQGLVWQQVFLPEYAPQEWQDRERLWNAVEAAEKAKDSRLAREFVVALPIELNREQQISLIETFVQDQFVSDGMCADAAIHDTDGHMYMASVTADDVKIAMLSASKKSASVYRSVQMLYKSIFRSALESHLVDSSPCENLSAKGGKPQKDKDALTDQQVEKLLAAVKGLPPYVFVMIGLYAGLRREEILGLKWDCVFLDTPTPYLSVQRAWHVEHNRPAVLNELKTNAAKREVPLPPQLIECLSEAKATSKSDYVVANRDGDPLSYTQFKRIWKYIETRTVKERSYVRYENGKKEVHTVTPVLGQKAAHSGNVVYSLDFHVTPISSGTHTLRT